jgi:FkbM family methyltransferase
VKGIPILSIIEKSMIADVQRIRTAIITSKLIGPIVRWGWKQYVTAIAINGPNDCAEIPKIAGAGKCFSDREGFYQLMHNGIKIRLRSYYDDLNKTIIEKLHGHHEPQEELVFYRVLQQLPESPVMIEVGSYWGYYSLWFKKEKPAGSVYLIEPLDGHLEAGKGNFKANHMKGEFFKAYVGSTSMPAHTVKMEGEIVKDVEKITIDDFMERHGIPYIDLLHADVQGAEFDLVKGAERALGAGKLSYIFISTHGAKVHNDCMGLLARYNFQIIATHTRAESFTTDGLIVARNKKIEGINEVPISKKKSGVFEDLRIVAGYIFSNHS